eukprot:SAG31_NODE_5216_length_2670_cov_1.605212_2_plen_208_part_00
MLNYVIVELHHQHSLSLFRSERYGAQRTVDRRAGQFQNRMVSHPRLICGLGNGLVYRRSRHGIGAKLVERLAAEHGARWRLYPTLAAWVAELHIVPPAVMEAAGESLRCPEFQSRDTDSPMISNSSGVPILQCGTTHAESAATPGAKPEDMAPVLTSSTAPFSVYLLWLLCPYNSSGWAVAAAARRFGVAVPAGVTIVHDDRARPWT